MEKHNPDEDKSKEQLREQLGVDPDELLDTIRRYMEVYKRYVLLQFPLIKALKENLKELFEKQYPGIKPYIQIWHVTWVFEAMENAALSVAIDLVDFFEKLEKGEDYKERYPDYDKLVQLYTKPYEAHTIGIEYDKLQLNEEQLRIYERVVEESNQDSLQCMKELNLERNEYLDVVYMQTLRFFGEQTETFTHNEWLHYEIIAGMGWQSYFEECRELNSCLIKNKMEEYPGMSYDQFLTNQREKFREEFVQKQSCEE